jgi:hypothetical protein
LEKLILGEDSWHGVMEGDRVKRCGEQVGELAASYLECAQKGLVDQFYSPLEFMGGPSFAGRYLEYALLKELSDRGLGLDQLLGMPENEAACLSREFLEKMSGR